MTPTGPGGQRSVRPIRRRALAAFLVGALIPLPATFLAMSVTDVEPLLALLAPGIGLLRALPVSTEAWPGAAVVLTAAALNGAVLSLLVVGASAALHLGRRARRG